VVEPPEGLQPFELGFEFLDPGLRVVALAFEAVVLALEALDQLPLARLPALRPAGVIEFCLVLRDALVLLLDRVR
jgi:hypothetical protein